MVAFGEHLNVAVLPSAPIGGVVGGTMGSGGHVLMPLKMQYALKLPLSSLQQLLHQQKHQPGHGRLQEALGLRGQEDTNMHPPLVARPQLDNVPLVPENQAPPFAFFWYRPLHPIPELDPYKSSGQGHPYRHPNRPYVLRKNNNSTFTYFYCIKFFRCPYNYHSYPSANSWLPADLLRVNHNPHLNPGTMRQDLLVFK